MTDISIELSSPFDRLKSWCSDHNLPWPDHAATQFECYFQLLMHYQKQTNLTGIHTADAFIDDLCMDSLQILRTGQIRGPVLDVGTGAGFPAIPIKILNPDFEMILIEPRTKRYAFLRRVEDELMLKNLTIIHGKIESAPITKTLGTAISKAFMPIMDWVKLATPWAKQGTQIACLVSQNDWLKAKPQLLQNGFTITGFIEENSRIYAVLSL